MNKKIKALFSYLLLVLIIILFIKYAYSSVSDFSSLSISRPHYLLILLFLFLLTIITNGLIIEFLTHPFSIHLQTMEWIGLSTITTFYNTITPFRGGAVARAIYLKNNYKFSYTKFLATLSGLYVMSFLISALCGVIVSGVLYFNKGIASPIIFTVFLAATILFLPIVLFSPSLNERKNKLYNKFVRVANGWHTISKNKKAVIGVSLISIINLLIVSLMLFLEFRVFGLKVGFTEMILLACINNLSLLISITPGSLGIKEAILVFTATSLQIPLTQSIAVSILDRAVSFVVLFILGPIFSYILLKRKPTNERKN